MTESPRTPCPPKEHYWIPIYRPVKSAWQQLAETGQITIDLSPQPVARCLFCDEVMQGWHGLGMPPTHNSS